MYTQLETSADELVIAHQTRSIIACLLGTFLLRMAAAVMGSMIHLYFAKIDREVMPLSFTVRSMINAVFFLPELFGSPVLGSWSDRYGRKLFIMLGPITGAVAVQITALTTIVPLLAFTRLLEGLSTASAIPATLGFLSAVTSKDPALRGRVMGMFEIATIGGTIGGILLGGPLFDAFQNHAFTWNSLMYLASLSVFYVGMSTYKQQKITAAPSRLGERVQHELSSARAAFSQSFTQIRATLSKSAILSFAPAWLAINMVPGLWINNVVGQLTNGNGRFPDQLFYGMLSGTLKAGTQISMYAGLVLGLFALGILVWSLVLGRFLRTTIMFIGAGALFVLVGAMFIINHSPSLTSPDVIPLIIVAGLALMVVSGFTPAALTYLADITEHDPVNRGAIMGVYTVLFGLGQFSGELLGGPFGDWRGFDGLLTLTFILGVIATATLLRLRITERVKRREAQAAS